MAEFFEQFFYNETDKHSLIIDDNGKVSYAYLLNGEEIIADVWLYNQAKTPHSGTWDSLDEIPFLNTIEYVNENLTIKPLSDPKDILIKWEFENDNLEQVSIFIQDKLSAILKPGSKPGWSICAKKDGPLARVLI
jgi:hypothetical protein